MESHEFEVDDRFETTGIDGEPTRNYCLRCFDSRVYHNSKYEKCRCCNRCPRLQNFFSNRYTRVFLLLISLFLFAWLIYCIWAIIELQKVKNSQLELTSLIVPNLCNPLVPYFLAANVSNPTSFEFALHSISVSVSYGDGPSFASTKFTPQFGSSNVFKGGMNYMSISNSISVNVDRTEELAKLVSALFSQAPNVRIVAHSTLDVTTNAFWFPIRTTISVPYELIVNDQTPLDQLDKEEARRQQLKPEPPSPSLFEVELIDWNSTPKPMNASDGLYVKSQWTLSPWDIAVKITVPDLYLHILVNNSYAGELHVSEFLYAWLSPAQVTGAIGFWDPDTAVMTGLQQLVANLTNYDNVTVSVTGSAASPLNNASETGTTCLAQSVLNVMPRTPVTFSLGNKTEDNSSSLQGRQRRHHLESRKQSTNQGLKSSNPFRLFAQSEEESSFSVSLSRVVSHSLKRMECPDGTQRVVPYNRGFSENCTLTLTVDVDFLFSMTNVTIWGKLPTLFMEIASQGDALAWMGLPLPYRTRDDAINGTTISMPVVLRVETGQEQKLYSRLVLDEESISDMQLTLRGRKGENGLSEVLAGMNLNMSTSEDGSADGGGGTGGDSTSNSEPLILRDSSLRINSTDTTLELDLNLLLNNAMLDAGFEVVIPSFLDVAISRDQTTSLLRFSQYGSFVMGVTANYSFWVRLDAQEGSNIAVMLNDFFDSKLTTFVAKNLANGAPNTVELDIFFDFTKDDLTASSTSSASPTRRRLLSTDMGPYRRLLQDTDLVDNLGSITLGKWYRETSGYDLVQLIVAPTMDLPIIAYGNIPAVNLELWTRPTNGSLPLLILSIDTTPFAVTYENEGIRGGNFSIAVDLSTESELDLYNTFFLGDINVRIQGRNTTDPSVISAFLTSLNVTIEADRTESSSGGSDSEPNDDEGNGIDWSVLSIFADTNETDLFINASTTLPAGILPVSIYLGDVDIQLSSTKPEFLHILDLDSGSTPLQYENCDECISDFFLRAVGTHSDGGRNLSQFLKRFLANEAPTMQLLGSFGNASVNVSFKAFKDFPKDIMQKLTHDLAENALPNATNPVANPTSGNSGIRLNAFQILGDGTGGPVTIPCVFPSFLCSNDSSLTSSNVSIAVNISVPNPLPMPLSLRLPAVSLDVDCCIHTRILRITTIPFTYMGQGNKPGAVEFNNVAFTTALFQPANLTLLYQAMHEIVTLDDLPSQVRIHGTSPANLLSSALSIYESVITFNPSSSNSTNSSTSTVSSDFKYWLSETTNNSATFTVQTIVDFPLSFPCEFGLVNFTLSYLGIDFASTSTIINLYPGKNPLSLDFKIFGMPTLAPPCTGATMVNPSFCVANEFISRMIGKDSYPEGTRAHLTAMFYNIHGTPITLHLDLNLFGEEPDIRGTSSSSSSSSDSESDDDLIDDFGAEVTASAWSFISSVTSSSFDLYAWVRIRNIFNVSLLATRIQADFSMKDWDGSHSYSQYPVGPYSINLAYPLSAINNPLSLSLTPGSVGQADLSIPLRWSSVTELAGRAFDDYYQKNRFCMHMRNGKLTLTLQGKPTDTPLTYTQAFRLDDITAAGVDACVIPTACWAQIKPVWSYPQFTNALRNNWKLNGNARWGTNILELTYNSDQVSSAWQVNQTYLLNRWQITFDFRTYEGTFSPAEADGFAFVIHSDGRGLNTIGSSCSDGFCHGYKGIQRAVGVIYDSYNLNEAATYVNGTRVAYTYANDNFDDENTHSFRVAYHPKKKKLEAWLDGKIMMMPTIDLNNVGLNKGRGYIGWTSSTGNVYYSTQYIGKSTFGGYLTIANNSFLVEKGLVRGMVGTQGWFTIDARDSCGEPRLEGGDTWSLTITSVENVGMVASPDRVEDHGDGTYRAFFTIPMGYPEGEYVVDGSVDGSTPQRLGSVLVAPAK